MKILVKQLVRNLGFWGIFGLVMLILVVMFNLVGRASAPIIPTVEQKEPLPSYTVETINLPEDIRYVDDIPQVTSFHPGSYRYHDYSLMYITEEGIVKIAIYGFRTWDNINSPNPTSYIVLQGDN